MTAQTFNETTFKKLSKSDKDYHSYTLGDDGTVKKMVDATLEVGDIEIGAVELKNADSDVRANILAANTARTTATVVLATQEVGADGTVPPTGSLVTNAPFAKITDGTDTQGVSSQGESYVTPAIPPFTHSSARDDFTATYTSNVTLTIAGAPITVTNSQLASITVNTSAGTSARTYVNGVNGVSMSISSNVITITGAGTPFAASDTYDVRLNLFDKSYDKTNDADMILVENQPTSTPGFIDWDTTNVATGTYYPSSTGVETSYIKSLGLNGKLIDGAEETTTLTFEVTDDEDTTNGSWVPIPFTLVTLTGGSSALSTGAFSVAATNQTMEFKIWFDNLNCRHLRAKIVTSASTNTVVLKGIGVVR